MAQTAKEKAKAASEETQVSIFFLAFIVVAFAVGGWWYLFAAWFGCGAVRGVVEASYDLSDDPPETTALAAVVLLAGMAICLMAKGG